ncbi:MAG: coenzyme A pyrophosphatase [Bacteroidetes bacterium 4572_77]|nr:MAG: coenzyme A pyrophosphatase [Bacteroidetes bacterium 4572_77]
MAPKDRQEGLLHRQWPKDAKQSAVTFLLYPVDNRWHVVVMKRVEYDGVHSGQISLPGGQKEAVDKDLLATAQREFEEETGVFIPYDAYVGPLSDLYIPPSNFLVQAFVAVLEEEPHFKPDASEVQELISLDLESLFSPTNFKQDEVVMRGGGGNPQTIKAPCYALKGLRIWGATAMIISEIQQLMEDNSMPTLLLQ